MENSALKVVSGHQPVYLPWLGLFHKLSLCDHFVYMDTVQYLDGDWNNRNKLRTAQGWMWLSVPIDRRASGKMLNEIVLRGHESPGDKDFWQKQHWRSIEVNYRRAPFFDRYAEDLRPLYLEHVWPNLIDLCWAQFRLFSRWLGLDGIAVTRMTERVFNGKKDALVLDHCQQLAGNAIVFGSQGRSYVDTNIFTEASIKVYFQAYQHPTYSQLFNGFESGMSVIDLLFNHGDASQAILHSGNCSRLDLEDGKQWTN